jgi:hypothetical protein
VTELKEAIKVKNVDITKQIHSNEVKELKKVLK